MIALLLDIRTLVNGINWGIANQFNIPLFNPNNAVYIWVNVITLISLAI
jgi:hypothetical protein